MAILSGIDLSGRSCAACGSIGRQGPHSRAAVALLECEFRITVGGIHEVINLLPIATRFIHQRSKLIITHSGPLLEELFKLMTIESAQWIVEAGLSNGPVDQGSTI